MKKSNISLEDAETIMIALDQVSQTIDVMNMIVGRLKRRMHETLDTQLQADRTETSGPSTAGETHTSKQDAIESGLLH